MLKADFHVHSNFSPDSYTTLDQIIEQCTIKGINCLALTDHNSIKGAIQLKERAPFNVIVGEEIMTQSGEIIGLFLTKEIPRGKTAEETVHMIKEQNGIVYIPHPFDLFFRPSAIKRKALNSILLEVDIIEVLNSHTMIGKHPNKIWKWAVENKLLIAAGSDAHKPEEIGNSYVSLPEFTDVNDFKLALAKAHIKGHITHPIIRGVTFINRMARRLAE